LSEALQLVANFRKDTQAPKNHGGTFDRAAIDKILAQPECARLWIYQGKNEDGTPNLVLAGVDAAGKDMVTGSVMDKILPCPPMCDGSSALLKA
jgi:hypothetical protein